MLKIIMILLLLTQIASGQVVLHRYYETATGDEMGISYSGENGNQAVNNSDWTVEIIDESQKEFYINLHKQQMKAKAKVIKDALKAKRKDIKDKLKALGFDQSEVDTLVGESL